LCDLVIARELQPASFKPEKIVANVRANCILGAEGAVRGMGLALFDFSRKKRRHPLAVLSQFDPEARDDGARQPLRIALECGSTKFDNPVGNRFANGVGIMRAMKQGQDGVEDLAQKLGTYVVKNGAHSHGATPT
jgi:hypothetical protein